MNKGDDDWFDLPDLAEESQAGGEEDELAQIRSLSERVVRNSERVKAARAKRKPSKRKSGISTSSASSSKQATYTTTQASTATAFDTALKRQQFMGGVDDDDERMLQFIRELQDEVRAVKESTRTREATMARRTQPWSCIGETETSVAPCRFHEWGCEKAKLRYAQEVSAKVDSRERVWHVYRVDIVDPAKSHEALAWFVGASDHVQEELLMILRHMITGEAPRRVRGADGSTSFSRFSLLFQTGHVWYRRLQSLDFFRFSVLADSTAKMNRVRNTTLHELAKIEEDAIELNNAWFTPGSVSKGRGGLNYYEPKTNRIHAKWGVSLQYLRTILDPDDFHTQFKTVEEIYRVTLRERFQGNGTFIDYLKKVKPEAVSENVDWFVSPGCHDCMWNKLIFQGGISIYAEDPLPLVKGDRFVYIDLFVT